MGFQVLGVRLGNQNCPNRSIHYKRWKVATSKEGSPSRSRENQTHSCQVAFLALFFFSLVYAIITMPKGHKINRSSKNVDTRAIEYSEVDWAIIFAWLWPVSPLNSVHLWKEAIANNFKTLIHAGFTLSKFFTFGNFHVFVENLCVDLGK